MGKRIFRLNPTEALLKSPQLLEKELSFVLTDGRVFIGALKKADQDFFYCENLLKNSFQINLKDLYEVIYDMTSNY